MRQGLAVSINSGVNRCPTVHSDVVDSDPTFGQQFFDVPVGESIAGIPADRHHDHVRRESEFRNMRTEADVSDTGDEASAHSAEPIISRRIRPVLPAPLRQLPDIFPIFSEYYGDPTGGTAGADLFWV